MTLSLKAIINDSFLPHWYEECEIQQGTYDITQTVTVDPTNDSLNDNVFGISNRPISTMYGIDKLLAGIIQNYHYDDGRHHIKDYDVDNAGLIRETPDINNDGQNDIDYNSNDTGSTNGVLNTPQYGLPLIDATCSLNTDGTFTTDSNSHYVTGSGSILNSETYLKKLILDFYGMPIPDETIPYNYSSTSQLAIKINEIYQYLDILRKGLGSHIAHRYTLNSLIQSDLNLTGFKSDPNINTYPSPRNNFNVFTGNMVLNINGTIVTLLDTNNLVTNSPSPGSSYIPLSLPTPGNPGGVCEADCIWLELYMTELTNSFVPYGNLQYGMGVMQNNVTVYNNAITCNITKDWLPNIVDTYNNIFIDPGYKLTQLQYKIASSTFNPSLSTIGLDHVKTISGKSIIRSNVRGIYKAADNSCLVFPIAIVAKRNEGIYHPALNPAGTAIPRLNVVINSVDDCFNSTKIAYYSNKVECVAYAVPNNISDIYIEGDINYYRSGTILSGVSGNPLGYFVDMVYEDDVIYNGKQQMNNLKTVVSTLTESIFSNSLYNELSPEFTGNCSSFIPGIHYSRNPVQVLGFGVSSHDMFGYVNNGGVFVDETNNDFSGVTDTVRTYWGDPQFSSPMSFFFIEGNDNSESRVYLSYNPVGEIVTLNTTALSGTPLISTNQPVLAWDTGAMVALNSVWTGLGTTTASCSITVPPAMVGHTVYGLVSFNYRYGSGVPFILNDIIKITDMQGNSYPFCYQLSDTYCLGCMWEGSITSGDIGDLTLPECIDCATPDQLVGGYVYVVSSTTVNDGKYAEITKYDCSTKSIILSTNFAVPLTSNDIISVGKLVPSYTTVLINPYGRGVVGGYKRQRVKSTSSIYISKLPIVNSSAGTITGTIVQNVTPNVYFEIITREDVPFTNGFYVYCQGNPMFYHYKSIPSDSVLEIIKTGLFIDTTKGSANTPYTLYREFVPTYSSPVNDDTYWISTDCDKPYFKLDFLDLIPFNLRMTEELQLTMTSTGLTTNETKLGSTLLPVSSITENVNNHSLRMGIAIVNINGWYYLLTGVKYFGNFTFVDAKIIDINSIY